jgi:ubiquinone/menaquinone biosynthesis C-methylase UbiE
MDNTLHHRGIPVLRLLDPDRIARLNRLYEKLRALDADADKEQERYGAAAQAPEATLCCAVEYERGSLAHIPQRILDVDYGCGDPTGYAGEGMTVVDLGSGSGKHAFMIARKVGPAGRVIGVDKTPQMLDLARGAVAEVTATLGHETPNVEFRRGHIENLWLDLDVLGRWLEGHAVDGYDALDSLDQELAAHPLVANDSVDLVVSNCVLNLVDDARKGQLLREVFRVLRRGGSVAISDIVADRDIPAIMKADAALWTGCISGAFRRDRFLDAFASAGFHGITEVASRFWKRVHGINFFSVTVRAWKGKQGPCYETHRSAMYRGPFSRVVDDDHHVFDRGLFVPVCEKTAELLAREPYGSSFHVTPRLEDPAKKIPFDCSDGGSTVRNLTSEQQTLLDGLIDQGACCEGEGCC